MVRYGAGVAADPIAAPGTAQLSAWHPDVLAAEALFKRTVRASPALELVQLPYGQLPAGAWEVL
jgi:hypothetical protein